MTQMTKQERIRQTKKKMLIGGLVLFALLLAGSVVTAVIAQTRKHKREQLELEKERGVIEYNGVKYEPKHNIETYLFIGVDKFGKVEKIDEFGDAGQCDVIIVMVRDLTEGTYKLLNINRNTMAEVDSIDIDGNILATTTVQLALAHARGDGVEGSCENTVNAISNFLGGQRIDGYAAVNMDALTIINDAVGGVTVTLNEDFTHVDKSMKKGETIRLKGKQAEIFVRSRMNMEDGSNENRIERENQFIDALMPLLKEKCVNDNSFPVDVYNELKPYMVTNIGMSKFSKIALLAAKDKGDGMLTLEGESKVGADGTAEYYVDEDNLQQTIIEMFYKQYK